MNKETMKSLIDEEHAKAFKANEEKNTAEWRKAVDRKKIFTELYDTYFKKNDQKEALDG